MSPRAQQLHQTVDDQLAQLAELLSAADHEALTRPCPGRVKLGDGTIGAVAAHTIDNYHRIAGFLAARQDESGHHQPGRHGDAYRGAGIEPGVLLARLAAARHALAMIGQLRDERLDSIPPAGEMKLADGERTLEQILSGLLKHQRHQVDAIAAGLA